MSQTGATYDPLAIARQQLLQSLRELEGAVMRMQSVEDLKTVLDVLRLIPETTDFGSYSPSLVDASQLLRTARERLARISRNSGQHGKVSIP